MNSKISGKIEGVSIDSALQILRMDNLTGTVTVTSGNRSGYLYFLNGRLISAQTGTLKNAKAACFIISWENVSIEISHSCEKTEDEIKQPLMNLLLEGVRLRDEAKEVSAVKARAEKMKRPTVVIPTQFVGVQASYSNDCRNRPTKIK